MINDKFKYLLGGMGIMVVLILLTWTDGCNSPDHGVVYMKPDTVFVDRPYKEIVIKEVEKEVPKTVVVYKIDTVYREQIEKDTLITAVEITEEIAKIHTITPKGIPLIQEYPMPEFKHIQIDHEGNTKIKRKKNRKRLKNTLRTIAASAIFVGGFYLGARTK